MRRQGWLEHHQSTAPSSGRRRQGSGLCHANCQRARGLCMSYRRTSLACGNRWYLKLKHRIHSAMPSGRKSMDLVLGFQYKVGLGMMGKTERNQIRWSSAVLCTSVMAIERPGED